AVLEVVEPFFAMAISKGNKIDLDVTEDVYLKGDREAIKQLVSLLLDNAIKYCNNGGKIFVSVSIKAKFVKLSVSNTLERIEQGKHDRLFDRFYRADDSRNSKTGGSGIGLAVAKEIVEAHSGSITAFSKDGKSIDFDVLLPH
ncbi:MAG: HAMP domain-containing histidine kinase, partial [Clostridiales bacterium]|nr:HAMP domain-containing histidine kinase [Clostridiales bacterium]